MRRTIAIVALLVWLFSATWVASASAAGSDPRRTAPATLQGVHFESDSDSLAVYSQDPISETSTPPAATWGRASSEHLAGSWGLWCAGTSRGSFPNYPTPTFGTAVLAAGDTSAFYQSWIQYSYIEPSWGALSTANPLSVSWVDSSRTPTSSVPPGGYVNPFLPLTGVWSTVVVPRDDSLPGIEPPTTAGYFRFVFRPSLLDTSTAEGPTLDDVMSTGYLYGPATSVAATRGVSPHSSVTVSWSPAWSSASTSTPTYAVWRHDIAADTWTEVTSARTGGTSVVDTGALVARSYEYAVQPWQGLVATADWGPLATSAPVPIVGSTTLTDSFSGSQSTTTAPYNGKVRLTGALADIDGQPVSGQAPSAFAVQSSPDGSTWTTAGPAVASTPAETPAGSYSTTLTITTDGLYYRLRFLGANGYSASIGAPSARVVQRPATASWGTLSATPGSPKYGATFSITATLTSETGQLAGRSGLVSLQSSTDGVSWVATSATIAENAPSVYTATIPSARTAQYRLVYAGESNYTSATAAPVSITVLANNSVLFLAPTVSSTSPVYGSTVSVGSTLTCESGVVTGRTTVKVQALVNAAVSFTATATEDSPGHYSAAMPVTATSADGLVYKFTYSGDSGQYFAAAAAQTGNISVVPATLSFANVGANPTVAISGKPSTISGDLVSQTGAAVRSTDASVTLLQSTDNSTWSTFAPSLVDSVTAGHYAAVVPSVTSHQYFRFIVASKSPTKYVPLSGNATSSAAEVTATADPTTSISGTFADGTTAPVSIIYGAGKKLVGTLRDSGGVAIFGHAADVVVLASPNGTSSWTTATVAGSTVESMTSSGSYEVTVTPTSLGTAYYKLAFGGAGDLSPSVSPTGLGITVNSAITAWSTPLCTPASVTYGDSSSVAATLSAASGAVGGQAATVVLLMSPNGSAWTTSSVPVAETTPGRYAAAVGPLTGSTYYRFRFTGVTGLSAADSGTSAQLVVNPVASVWSAVPASTTYAYGASASFGGSLAGTSPIAGVTTSVVLQTSANGSSGWTTATASITEPSAAYYSASFAPTGTGAYYRLAYVGAAGVYAAAYSPAVAVSSIAVATGWSNEHASATSVALGSGTTVSAQLLSSAALTGESGRVTLMRSTDGSTWTTDTASVTEPVAGTYSANVTGLATPGTIYFRLHFAGEFQKYDPADSASVNVIVNKDQPQWSGTGNGPTALSANIGHFELHGTLEDGSGVAMTGAGVVCETAPVSSPASWTVVPNVVQAQAGGYYTATIAAPATDTVVRLRFVGDSTHNEASWAAPQLSISIPTPAFASWRISSGNVGWGGSAVVFAQLTLGGVNATDTAGSVILLQRSYNAGATWETLGNPVTHDDAGVFSATTPPVLGLTWFRLHADHTTVNYEFASDWLSVTPTTYFTTPALSTSKPKHNKAFAVSGKVSGVPYAWRTITLKAEHKETKVVKKKKTTVWVVRVTATVLIAPSSVATAYKVSMKVKQTGSWRLRAYVADAYSTPGTSAYRSFTAK